MVSSAQPVKSNAATSALLIPLTSTWSWLPPRPAVPSTLTSTASPSAPPAHCMVCVHLPFI